MRSYFEALETTTLESYAVKSSLSKGRLHPEPPSHTRTIFQRDRDRIIHSKSFRRLKRKTQVFVVTISDHYRSRLTHTIEVAQLSRHLSRLLHLNEDLSECIAYAHDLGHPPFGHAGEKALDTMMKNHGGFEHNLQSLRVVDELEQKYPDFDGLNLSYEVRRGLLKHPKLLKGFPQFTHNQNALEAQLVNLADEIAYNNHDIDDGLTANLLHLDALKEHITLVKQVDKEVSQQYTALQPHQRRHLINSALISKQVMNVYEQTKKNITTHGIKTHEDVLNAPTPLVTFSPDMSELNKELKAYLFTNLYRHPDVVHMNKHGQHILQSLFEAFCHTPSHLPESHQKRIGIHHSLHRVITDYIAGMTDIFAAEMYQKLFPAKIKNGPTSKTSLK